jgi:hypothetical protein
MIYRGPGFLAVVGFGSLPTSSPIQFDPRIIGSLRNRDNFLTGEGGRGWARSRIIQPQERLVLYKSFNTLWYTVPQLFRWESPELQNRNYVLPGLLALGNTYTQWSIIETSLHRVKGDFQPIRNQLSTDKVVSRKIP